MYPVSPSFHYHHDIYATVLIAPSIKDSRLIGNCLNSDNLPRLESAIHGKGDPGRTAGRDWFLVSIVFCHCLNCVILTSTSKGVSYKYELIILHPSHFLMDNSYVVIKHPSTGHPTAFYASNDGFLHEGSPTGPRLPPFGSRGIIDREIPLNPILVSFAAKLRLRRLDHQIPGWRTRLHPEAQEVLAGVDKVHKATVWEPEPLLKAYNARKRAPLQGLHPQLTRQGVYPTMRWEDAMKLIHSGNFLSHAGPYYFLTEPVFQDFQDLPDLGGENSSPKHPDLDSDLGVMTNEEKIEKFLAGSQ